MASKQGPGPAILASVFPSTMCTETSGSKWLKFKSIYSSYVHYSFPFSKARLGLRSKIIIKNSSGTALHHDHGLTEQNKCQRHTVDHKTAQFRIDSQFQLSNHQRAPINHPTTTNQPSPIPSFHFTIHVTGILLWACDRTDQLYEIK